MSSFRRTRSLITPGRRRRPVGSDPATRSRPAAVPGDRTVTVTAYRTAGTGNLSQPPRPPRAARAHSVRARPRTRLH
eukprot:712714-Hanusia_phi.AAC.4